MSKLNSKLFKSKMSENGDSGGAASSSSTGFKLENVVDQCVEMNQNNEDGQSDLAGKNGTYQLKKKRSSMSSLYKGK